MLLRTIYSEVCGTDVHLWHGRLAGVPYPIIPGHVSVGLVDKMRGEVTAADGHALREGDRLVFFDVHRTCGRCYACAVSGTPTKCAKRKVYGITDSANDGLFGGWSEAIYLEPGVVAAVLPRTVTRRGLHRRRLRSHHRRARHRPGGACGWRIACWCRAPAPSVSASSRSRGCPGRRTIVAIGAPADRLDLATRMGADVDARCRSRPADERTRSRVMEATGGRGVDVGIEAAGSPRAVEEGLTLVRDGGRYVIAGHYTDAGPSAINAHEHINRKHLEIRGCWGSEAGHFLRALTILEQHARACPVA